MTVTFWRKSEEDEQRDVFLRSVIEKIKSAPASWDTKFNKTNTYGDINKVYYFEFSCPESQVKFQFSADEDFQIYFSEPFVKYIWSCKLSRELYYECRQLLGILSQSEIYAQATRIVEGEFETYTKVPVEDRLKSKIWAENNLESEYFLNYNQAKDGDNIIIIAHGWFMDTADALAFKLAMQKS